MNPVVRAWYVVTRPWRLPAPPLTIHQFTDEWLDPQALRGASATHGDPQRFKVVYDGRVIYQGPRGSQALAIWESCQPTQAIELWDREVCRGRRTAATIQSQP